MVNFCYFGVDFDHNNFLFLSLFFRAYCYRRATAAYVRGDSALAKQYSIQGFFFLSFSFFFIFFSPFFSPSPYFLSLPSGKEYDKQIKQCQETVFGNVFNSSDNQIKLDLHGLPVGGFSFLSLFLSFFLSFFFYLFI